MKRLTYSNYKSSKYRTKKYSNSKLNGFRRKNSAAMAAGKQLAEELTEVKKERVLVPLATALKDPILVEKIKEFKRSERMRE